MFVVTYNSRPTLFPGSFPSLGFAATSTKELGDHIRLSGTDRLLSSIQITLTNWACENDFSLSGGVWTPLRSNTDPCQTNSGSSYNHPITMNIYTVDSSGANPAVGTLLTSKTINAAIPFRPSWDSVNCTASGQTPSTNSPFGGKWFDPTIGNCVSGYNFDLSFDFSSEHLILPNDIIVSIAYNTSHNGYAPIGQTGSYNSLNVGLGTTGPNVGTDVEPDAMFWNTTFAPNYTDGGAGGVGVFRRDTTWSPYGLVTKFTMAGDEAPTISIENPSPIENSYVRGSITGRAIANDDIGMGSYYLRFWQNGFDIAGGGTLRHGCQSAPGGTGLGTNQDVSCSYNTTLNPDGIYVFSAQFLDSKNQWGQALRTFTVDNTKPMVTLSSPTSGITVLNSNTQDLIVDATDNFALDRIVGNIYQGGTLFRSTQWVVPGNSANGTHTIDLATVMAGSNPLPQGSYTLRYNAKDMSGNISETKNFDFVVDNTAPSFWVKGANWGNTYTPTSVGSGNVFSKVSFKLFESQKIDKITINGIVKDLSNNNYSDVNNVAPGVFGAVAGNNTLVVYDVAGNTTSYDFILDTVAPVTTDSGTDTNWHNTPVTVTLNCSDVSGSGCKTTYYTIDGSEPTTSSATGNSITLNTDGIHTIKYFSIDNAGNVENVKTAANTVKIDISNPTTPTVLGFLNPSLSCGVVTNIHNTTVDWSNSTDNNGAVTYEYNIDYPLPGGGRGIWSTSLANSQYGGSLNEGLHRIKVRAKDSVGNYSDWSNTCDITADWTTPTTVLTSPTNNFITNTGIDIVGTSNDLNGVDLVRIYYSEAGQNNWQEITTLDNTDSTLFDFNYLWSPAENGTYDIKVSGTDIAGNIEASDYALNVKYDNVLPSSIITNYNLADGGSIETNEFTGLIEGTAADLTSGISHVLLSISHLDFGADESETTYWDATASAWVATESMFSATGTDAWNYQLTDVPNGIYNITSHAVDNAGNVENTYNIRIVYDKTIPEVALAINPASTDGDNGWYRYTKPTITLTASDNYNLDHIEYQWNSTSGTWLTYASPFVTPSEGQNILYYRSIDSVGNVSGLGIKEVKYDKTNPAGEPLEVKVDNVTSNTADATWKKPTDDSDVSHYRVVWRHENGTEYSVETGKDDFAHQLDRLFNGLWTLTVQAVDSAGNFTEKKIDFRVGPGPVSSESSNNGGSVLGTTTSTTNGTAPFITQTSVDEDEATTTSDQDSNTTNNQPEGTVLGATTCNGLESYLPIILLVAQLLVLLAVEVLNRDAGIGKLVASIAITVAMIPLYYLLRNPDCFTQGSGLDVINNWFAGITIATGLAAKLIGKSLFEEK